MLCSLFMKDILPAGKLFACLSLSKKIKLQKFMTKKLICVHLYSSPWTCNLMSGLDINVEMGFDLAELSSGLISSLQEVEAVLGWGVCVSRSCGLCVWQHSDILWGLSPSPCTGAEQCWCSRIHPGSLWWIHWEFSARRWWRDFWESLPHVPDLISLPHPCSWLSGCGTNMEQGIRVVGKETAALLGWQSWLGCAPGRAAGLSLWVPAQLWCQCIPAGAGVNPGWPPALPAHVLCFPCGIPCSWSLSAQLLPYPVPAFLRTQKWTKRRREEAPLLLKSSFTTVQTLHCAMVQTWIPVRHN